MDIISFDDFKKLEIRIGKIISAEKIEGSDKLLKLWVDFGPSTVKKEVQGEFIPVEPSDSDVIGDERVKRQIIAGIAQFYAPEALIGKECPFAYNLAPRVLKGLESQGMILCPSDVSGPILLHPDKEITPGSLVK
jgi:tRNA-binding EMAP/Myf-like protein